MFLGSTGAELEAVFLSSGRRFLIGERIQTIGERRSPSLFGEREYDFGSHLEKGSCDEEEYYSPISKGVEEPEESAETLRSERNYTTPVVSPKVRPRTSSP